MTEQERNQVQHLLSYGADTISRLRRENEIMQAQLSIVAVFQRALLGPAPSVGAEVSVEWEMKKFAEHLKQQPVEPPRAPPPRSHEDLNRRRSSDVPAYADPPSLRD